MMEDFFKNIKDNPAYKTDMPPPGTVPEATPVSGVKDDNIILRNLEEDVRRTIAKLETNDIIDIDEINTKLNEISEQSEKTREAERAKEAAESRSNTEILIDKAMASFSVLTKPSSSDDDSQNDPYKESYDNDNVLAFLN
ncbi:uncharacterized protein LOC113493982 isoform X1 [Trichoplusia ni]|uniref:Uncharacterized protein LOC113493982 isoform X1 n=1 Tax=Trichoplusia ni TaxID=7111 RepID=A0A7E5VHS2_TRINI|nr:uncharacterized protein LOC113493982 isoform X1 [Trichoplusia ni]